MTDERKPDRRQFLQLMGAGALASTLSANIARALGIPANFRTGTIQDVEHIVILMQENRPFDSYFGTMKGVRGFSDPRAVKINLPVLDNPSGNGTITGNVQVPVFLQPQGLQTIPAPLAYELGLSSSPSTPGPNVYFGTGLPASVFAGAAVPANAEWVIPPIHVNPELLGLQSQVNPSTGLPIGLVGGFPPQWSAAGNLGLAYLPGANNGWQTTHLAWNYGWYDQWIAAQGPFALSYLTREDIPYHHALADAFTVGDNYFCSVMGPTNPNRYHLFTGCTGNVEPFINPDGSINGGGVDGAGSGPRTANGLGTLNGAPAYLLWSTFPEVLTSAGISWKIYQDMSGTTFAGDFGGGGNSFAGNFQDNAVLYFSQYETASKSSPLFQNAVVTGSTNITGSNPDVPPSATLPTTQDEQDWSTWASHLFDKFRADVQADALPQVSWIVGPAGYSEHPDWPSNYGAWYISQIFDILVSNPAVFAKTAFIIDFDEAGGAFDHIVPPTPPLPATLPGLPAGAQTGASTVPTDFEIVTHPSGGGVEGPVGLGNRVPFLVISPWSKGGYVNSQVFDHTSVIKFIEKRFGVHSPNITPWRRAVTGDLTSCFNFATPNGPEPVVSTSTDGYLPPVSELSSGSGASAGAPNYLDGLAVEVVEEAYLQTQGTPAQAVFTPPNGLPPVIPGVPQLGTPQSGQTFLGVEKGIRRARALPYEMDVHATVRGGVITLELGNTGQWTVVFQVRSIDPTVLPRTYTVEPGKKLADSWPISLTGYSLSVYGPNGFYRGFSGGVGGSAVLVDAQAGYGHSGFGSLRLRIASVGEQPVSLVVTDAYTGKTLPVTLHGFGEAFVNDWSLNELYGWYDLVVTAPGVDPLFQYRFAGHVETGRDSASVPAMGGLVTLQVPV